ncbi:CobW family GTP-binding protein [Gudongella sp. DL1XJH-153]|uniref:CobW family GTP-binding protein n=1 Tax=Gudongella sp. DL1XJH-153 TaxID=3409804 RepID=UPI003BB6EFBD
MKKKIDLYLLTGFLGAGKTTFLRNILEELSHEKVGVIMNEFGKIGIDGDIIRKDGLQLTEINRGSIFCSCLKLNFAQSMLEMADKDIKYLFVESSGLADPSNIGEIMAGVKSFKGDIYQYKGAICVADALNFMDQLDDLETVERQIKHCHLAVLSKTDLVDEERLAGIIERIKEINPRVPIETSSHGRLDYNFLKEDLMQYKWSESEDTTNVPENKPKTLTINFDSPLESKKLSDFIDEIKKDAYRIKGFARLEDGWSQIDVVGNRLDIKTTESRNEEQLVVISKIGPQIIRPMAKAWDEKVGIPMKMR